MEPGFFNDKTNPYCFMFPDRFCPDWESFVLDMEYIPPLSCTEGCDCRSNAGVDCDFKNEADIRLCYPINGNEFRWAVRMRPDHWSVNGFRFQSVCQEAIWHYSRRSNPEDVSFYCVHQFGYRHKQEFEQIYDAIEEVLLLGVFSSPDRIIRCIMKTRTGSPFTEHPDYLAYIDSLIN